jgi:hypothetical protein
MTMHFNPPPNWPAPPSPNWTPPPGWQPDPSWGAPPPGWQLWVDDFGLGTHAIGMPPPQDQRPWYRKKRLLAPIGVVGALILVGSFAPGSDTATTVADSPAAREPVAMSTTPAPSAEPTAAAEPTVGGTTAAPEPEPARTETVTSGQRNAVDTAEQYLEYQAFSRKGLLGQLRFEGFTKSEATYAVDHVDVDWKDQAVKSAEQYLSHQSFSRSGLIDQLEFEGFTKSQARHGVDVAY